MKGKTFIPRDYDVFAGLDVDKRSISVTFSNHQGFISSLRMPYSTEHLIKHVRKHFGDQKVAFAHVEGLRKDVSVSFRRCYRMLKSEELSEKLDTQ